MRSIAKIIYKEGSATTADSKLSWRSFGVSVSEVIAVVAARAVATARRWSDGSATDADGQIVLHKGAHVAVDVAELGLGIVALLELLIEVSALWVLGGRLVGIPPGFGSR